MFGVLALLLQQTGQLLVTSLFQNLIHLAMLAANVRQQGSFGLEDLVTLLAVESCHQVLHFSFQLTLPFTPDVNNDMGVQRLKGFVLFLTQFTGKAVVANTFLSGTWIKDILSAKYPNWQSQMHVWFKLHLQKFPLQHIREPFSFCLSSFKFSSFSACLSAPRNLATKLLL